MFNTKEIKIVENFFMGAEKFLDEMIDDMFIQCNQLNSIGCKNKSIEKKAYIKYLEKEINEFDDLLNYLDKLLIEHNCIESSVRVNKNIHFKLIVIA